MSTMSTVRLPAGPLLAELERVARVRQQAIEDMLGGRTSMMAFCRARKTGTISLIRAETWCEEILGCHPYTLFGEAWNRAAEQAANLHTLDTHPPGSRAAYDRGCRCPDCRAAKAASRRRTTRGEAAA